MYEKKCVPCSYIKGYKDPIKKNGQCTEICGDGLNLGQYKCDDGNLANGDGCSSKCLLELG